MQIPFASNTYNTNNTNDLSLMSLLGGKSSVGDASSQREYAESPFGMPKSATQANGGYNSTGQSKSTTSGDSSKLRQIFSMFMRMLMSLMSESQSKKQTSSSPDADTPTDRPNGSRGTNPGSRGTNPGRRVGHSRQRPQKGNNENGMMKIFSQVLQLFSALLQAVVNTKDGNSTEPPEPAKAECSNSAGKRPSSLSLLSGGSSSST